MSINISNVNNVSNPDVKSKLHLMPCKIHANEESKIEQYFEPMITNKYEDLQSSFRGHKLNGQTVKIPEGYSGLVLHETSKPVTETQNRKFYVTNNFNEFTYWNWDKKTTKNDAVLQILDWIDIADALHSPIMDDL